MPGRPRKASTPRARKGHPCPAWVDSPAAKRFKTPHFEEANRQSLRVSRLRLRPLNVNVHLTVAGGYLNVNVNTYSYILCTAPTAGLRFRWNVPFAWGKRKPSRQHALPHLAMGCSCKQHLILFTCLGQMGADQREIRGCGLDTLAPNHMEPDFGPFTS